MTGLRSGSELWGCGSTINSRDAGRHVLVTYNKCKTLTLLTYYRMLADADDSDVLIIPGPRDHHVQLVSHRLEHPLVLHCSGEITFVDGAACHPVKKPGLEARQLAGIPLLSSGEVPATPYAIIIIIKLGPLESLMSCQVCQSRLLLTKWWSS